MLSAVLLPVLAVVTVGCGGNGSGGGDAAAAPSKAAPAPASSAPQQPQTEAAARQAAQEHADAYAAGDYEGTWQLWAPEAQKVLSQQNYVRLFELCPQPAQNVPMKVEAVRLSADKTTATVRIDRLGFKFSYRYVYEGGRWGFMPDKKTLDGYRLGVDKLAAQKKQRGECG
ncbi:hypothetical protein [Thermomonospora cellulosilytica]|uniref:Uncharacterized protein n=1 Tax=Thermomonospora cellulosilytica TaxID=1411118 RepID=A0A7W3RB43_9ACTN|nr:hypothetical protein [Thermomonospora cellulosilytica]MBA9005940.1 hypothetical protein [Thermomonospora cellulosilytica]